MDGLDVGSATIAKAIAGIFRNLITKGYTNGRRFLSEASLTDQQEGSFAIRLKSGSVYRITITKES